MDNINVLIVLKDRDEPDELSTFSDLFSQAKTVFTSSEIIKTIRIICGN